MTIRSRLRKMQHEKIIGGGFGKGGGAGICARSELPGAD